jgi:hypothetical protein
MTTKTLIVAAALLAGAALTTLGTASPTLAQEGNELGAAGQGVYGPDYGYGRPAQFWHSRRSYDYAPAVTPNIDRGGPGPRVQSGSGMGIGAER